LSHGEARVRVEFQQNGRLEREDFGLEMIGRNGRFLELLNSDTIQTIHTQEATLEEIFIEVTGRALQ
jgi:fluoroquinolone transport system ATP-binding protein